MWAEKGGLDFEGRAKWDAWSAVKGTPANKAMLAFVKVCIIQGRHSSSISSPLKCSCKQCCHAVTFVC